MIPGNGRSVVPAHPAVFTGASGESSPGIFLHYILWPLMICAEHYDCAREERRTSGIPIGCLGATGMVEQKLRLTWEISLPIRQMGMLCSGALVMINFKFFLPLQYTPNTG